MGEGTIERPLEELRKMAGKLPDNRKAGNRRKYEMANFVLSAFAVFYSQWGLIPRRKLVCALAAVRIGNANKKW